MLYLENSALQEVLEIAIDPPMTLQSPSHKDSLTTNQISQVHPQISSLIGRSYQIQN